MSGFGGCNFLFYTSEKEEDIKKHKSPPRFVIFIGEKKKKKDIKFLFFLYRKTMKKCIKNPK